MMNFSHGKAVCSYLAGIILALSAVPVRAANERPTVVGLQFVPLLDYLKQTLADPRLSGARVGVRVDDLSSGKTLFAHNPDLLLNPASVTKTFTTAAGLCLLHPDYRFKTEVYARNEPKEGVIKGPLYLKGYGDPFLIDQRLHYLALELQALDIKKIEGPIIVDDSFFDDVREGPGWSQDSSSRAYQAPVSALSLDFNTVRVLVFPGAQAGKPARVELMPESDHFRLVNHIVTRRGRSRVRIETESLGRRTRVTARGHVFPDFPGSRRYLRIYNPTLYTGYSFREALGQLGIRTQRRVRRGTAPHSAELIYTLRSPALGELVRKVNKRSQNFMAEQIFKTMGAEFLGVPGSWYKGQQVMNAFLAEEVGIPAGSYVLHNGSGLNDVNRVSVSHVVKLLRYMWRRFDVRPDFLASLAVAGADGTVAGRFIQPALVRTMRLKTGGLHNVRALAGYINTRGDRVYAFAMIVNDFYCEGYQASHTIDRLATAIARADANLQVEEQIEVLPLDGEDQSLLISPAGPPEGTEEEDIPVGEQPEEKKGGE
jgi:serine-type D-Ala-D-Ala carboxypeptidase/endopeptidase (penicillin-binding protein 4)